MKVLSIIRPVGLAPGKSKHIIAAAKMICERFSGEVPATFEELESLPGVGHKTASVVMTQVRRLGGWVGGCVCIACSPALTFPTWFNP